MHTLSFKHATRTGSKENGHVSKSERKYLDFLISGQSLEALLNTVSQDMIGTFGWSVSDAYENSMVNAFLGLEKPELPSGRIPFYVCPECGDIECGAITAEVEVTADSVVWKNFGFENNQDEPNLIDYKEIGPFKFDKTEYVKCFEAIKRS